MAESPMREERSHFGLTTLNGSLYAIGGFGYRFGRKKSTDRLDAREGKRSPMADMHSGKKFVQAASIGGRIFAYGDIGEDPVAEFYDTIADRWQTAKEPPGDFSESAMTWCSSGFNG